MTDRYTRSLLSVIAIASTVLLTSCSNPDTSGGVTLSKGADDANEYPHGSCEGPGKNPHTYAHGCGWISVQEGTPYEGSYFIMPRADLSGAILFNAYLPGANLSGANLTGADLRVRSLINADLRDADLTGSDVRYVILTNAYLRGANLTRVRLNHSTLTVANLHKANLGRADLRDADLSGADLRDLDLRDLDLTGADLTGAHLYGVIANSSTICPNGINWGTAGNNCGF